MQSQGSSPQPISDYAVVPILSAMPFDTPMDRRTFNSRRRSYPRARNVLRREAVTILFVLHCFILQFDLNGGIAVRASDPDGVAPLIPSHYTASQRMNHERMYVSSRLRHSEADSEVQWSRGRMQQAVAACSAYPVCAAAGLVNDCCPTSEGVFLGCCEVTSSPVSAPMKPPEPSPTGKPTLKPIQSTDAPTSSPVRKPTTQSPTAAPQPPPTTRRPTRSPTLPPVSNAPITSQPTEKPVTSSPVDTPTTPSPTLAPSALPPATSAPVSSPTTFEPVATLPPAPAGSDGPSSVPSPFIEYNITFLTVPDVRLALKNGGSGRRRYLQESGSNCTQFLKDALMDRIEKEIVSIIQKYESLRVDIQNLTSTFSNASLATYVFDVLIEIGSPMQEYEPNRYVEGPFDSQVEKNLFAETLRSSDCPQFSDVSTVDIDVPRKEEDKSPSGSDSSALSVGVLAGIVAGAAVLMLVLGAVFIMSRKRRRMLLDEDSLHPPVQKPTQEMLSNDYEFSEIDGFHFNTGDVSTLGDPMSTDSKRNLETATLDSVGADYDFKKAFLDVQSVTDSQLCGENSDGSSPRRRVATLDDPSLLNGGSTSDIVTAAGDTQSSPIYGSEEQYDVVAPAGVLGLIIESSVTDGRPVVHNIKPTSPLAHIVRVGDRLVALDGVVVSALRASDVSRLIAEKKDKSRLLVFSRPMNV